jgi:hypothetical protein
VLTTIQEADERRAVKREVSVAQNVRRERVDVVDLADDDDDEVTVVGAFADITKDDIITIIGGYRGHVRGLQSLTRTELVTMLTRYREKAAVKAKRERDEDEDDGEATILGVRDRKRRCGPGDELIELD